MLMVLCLCVTAYMYLTSSRLSWLYWAAGGAVLLVVSLSTSRWLVLPNRLWIRVGRLLHVLMSPLVLGAMYYCVVVPAALLLRAMRKDPLRLTFDKNARTYWQDRVPPGPDGKTFQNPF
jgi:hypothetical protein